MQSRSEDRSMWSIRGGIDFKCLCTSENIRRKRLYSKEDGCFQSDSNLVRKVITLSNKVYVDVLAEFSKDGLLIPKEITWEDGRKYEITRVKDKRRAASTRAGGVGERYTCVVDGKEKYNSIYKVQMPPITPHVCRHTFCSNMAKSGMNPKMLQYIMGHSDISVTMNTYTHVKFQDAQEDFQKAINS